MSEILNLLVKYNSQGGRSLPQSARTTVRRWHQRGHEASVLISVTHYLHIDWRERVADLEPALKYILYKIQPTYLPRVTLSSFWSTPALKFFSYLMYVSHTGINDLILWLWHNTSVKLLVIRWHDMALSLLPRPQFYFVF